MVGADGLWSVVRRRLDAASAGQPPRITGHTAWRALARQDALPPALRRGGVEVWLGPQLHAVAYPVRAGEWLNVVVIAESAPAGNAHDWDQASSLAALQAAALAAPASTQPTDPLSWSGIHPGSNRGMSNSPPLPQPVVLPPPTSPPPARTSINTNPPRPPPLTPGEERLAMLAA